MKMGPVVDISVTALKAHKTRSMLASLGVMIGIAAVIIMVAIGKGSEQEVMEVISRMGRHLITIQAGEVKRRGDRLRLTGTVTTLRPRDAQQVRVEVPQVQAVAPFEIQSMKVKFGRLVTQTQVAGSTPSFFTVRQYDVARGNYFTDRDLKLARRVAIIGQTTLKNIFGLVDPIGQVLRIRGIPFRVIGVFRSKGLDSNGMDQDDIILVPLTTLLRRVLNQTHITTIYARAGSRDSIPQAVESIRAVLREAHRLRPQEEDDFSIVSQLDIEEMKRETTELFTKLIVGVAAISLVVGGIGILAVMLASVKERTREIGLRRAVGATRPDIVQQFLMESIVIGLWGGGIGIALGVVITLGVNRW
ncbi:MAG: FtsX-like permease family protein, partial [Nitrospinaceae bacterium]|nr:ABC transporter permease [Nitrospinaceae bacterium]NIR55766.1 ABC transporter permease [Nitrospinaceae bacterium]NIS86214.1 ABC transporter permease [Nitrospinaceae bacterium]NIT83049.1 ABC transporter permease [Nitrospinaceae bacterium]NIU45259.1 ABC transporter permease [Nitrospinaceae bacterium]